MSEVTVKASGELSRSGSPLDRLLTSVRSMVGGLQSDAELIDHLSELEAIISACGAAQIRLSHKLHERRVEAVRVRLHEAPASLTKEATAKATLSAGKEIGLARRESTATGRLLLTVADTVCTWLPRTLAALDAGLTTAHRVRLVSDAARRLPEDRRDAFDAMVAPQLVGATNGQVERRAAAAVYRLDPDGALARIRRAITERGVSSRPVGEGLVRLSVTAPLVGGVAGYAALRKEAQSARVAGDPRTLDQIMSDEAIARLTGGAIVGCDADGLPLRVPSAAPAATAPEDPVAEVQRRAAAGRAGAAAGRAGAAVGQAGGVNLGTSDTAAGCAASTAGQPGVEDFVDRGTGEEPREARRAESVAGQRGGPGRARRGGENGSEAGCFTDEDAGVAAHHDADPVATDSQDQCIPAVSVADRGAGSGGATSFDMTSVAGAAEESGSEQGAAAAHFGWEPSPAAGLGDAASADEPPEWLIDEDAARFPDDAALFAWLDQWNDEFLGPDPVDHEPAEPNAEPVPLTAAEEAALFRRAEFMERLEAGGRPAGPMCGVEIRLHLVLSDRTLLAASEEPAILLGHGPIPAGTARRLAALPDDRARTTLRPYLTDPVDGRLADCDPRAREFPAVVKEFLATRDQECRGPFCGAPIRHHDHVIPVAAGGPTIKENGQGLCISCNQIKETPGWTATVDELTGTITTRTPTGHTHSSPEPTPVGSRGVVGTVGAWT